MGTLGEFDIGDRPVITAVFADVAGGTGVSSAVTFIVKGPDGVETPTDSPSAAIDSPAPNTWTYTFATLTEPGRYYVRAKSTAGLTAAAEASFFVRTSSFVAP